MTEKILFAVRIRGGIDVNKKVEDTLTLLRMEKNNYATLLRASPSYMGMLRKVKDLVTWGEPTTEMITYLLKERGKLVGDKKVTDESIKDLGYESVEKLADAIHKGEVEFSQLNGVKPFFRMHPPKKGFKNSVKHPYHDRGELGNRDEAINELIPRMC